MSKKLFPGMALVAAAVGMLGGVAEVPSMPMRGEDLPPPIFKAGRGRVGMRAPPPRTWARGGFPWPKTGDPAALARAVAKRERKAKRFVAESIYRELRKHSVRTWIEDFSDQVRRDRWADEDGALGERSAPRRQP